MVSKLISIIVPAYNEEALLKEFLSEIIDFFNRKIPNYELLLIENGSQDKTLQIAKKFVLTNKRIKVFHLAKPAYGAALIFGMKKAKGDYLVIYNVDFWDRKFIELARVDLLGYDVVVGSKNLSGSEDRRPLGRRFVTKGFNFLLKILFGYKGTDSHGIKVLRRKTVMSIVKKCQTKTGIFDSEMMIRAQRAGRKILEVPVKVFEKRPNRFGYKRILTTPIDLVSLYFALKR